MGKPFSATIADKHPHLVAEWHPTLNGANTPSKVGYGSQTKNWWLCPEGHAYQSAPNARAYGNGCPYCCGKIVTELNSLVALCPLVASEWDYERNSVSPNTVPPNSHMKVWWRCQKGHQWRAVVKNRTLNESGCPFCENKSACPDNSLATLFPHIAAQWDHAKNKLTPDDVTPGSGRRVWWLCDKGHSWLATIGHRTTGNCCPRCYGSMGEKRVAQVLALLDVRFKQEVRFSQCKNIMSLPYDFVVFPAGKDPGIIEFHGKQHYVPVAKFGGEADFKLVKHRDAIKEQFAVDKKMSMLIISYRNFNRIEELINEFIGQLPPIRKGLILKY
jgi:hypothetical protein